MPEALVLYAFAAMANESSALLAMGYSHMKGLGVPKSCESAALYYIAAADQVVAAAQQPGGLDAVCSAMRSTQYCCICLMEMASHIRLECRTPLCFCMPL